MWRLRAAALLLAMTTITAAQTNTVRMQESGIRRHATQKPLPGYPASSIAQGRAGVAVAAIVTDEAGRIATVDILEAPDAAIAEAVKAALSKWMVSPTTVLGRTELYGLRGKLTFYFRLEKGRGRVYHPEEMPGGPKPEPPGGPPSGAPGVRGNTGSTPTPAPTVVSHESAADLEIGRDEFVAFLASARPTVLDIRSRDDFRGGHHPAAVNIPGDELAIRGYIEVDRARPVAIDCSLAETRACHAAARTLLRGVGLSKVLIFLP